MNPQDFGITVEVEDITPEQAAKYLSYNAEHRPIKQSKVDKYAGQMARGEWALNGKVLVFDSNGRLLGGQHRLSACVQSGVTLRILTVKGIDPSVFKKDEE